jgi:hypothetical protein
MLPKGKMPGKTGIEDHDVKTSFRLMSYTFGIIPVYSGLLSLAQRRLKLEAQLPSTSLSRHALISEIVGKCRAWRDDHRSTIVVREALSPSLWYSDLVWVAYGQIRNVNVFEVDTVWDRAALQLGRLGTQPPALKRRDRLTNWMIRAYPKILGEVINDWAGWKAFKQALLLKGPWSHGVELPVSIRTGVRVNGRARWRSALGIWQTCCSSGGGSAFSSK